MRNLIMKCLILNLLSLLAIPIFGASVVWDIDCKVSEIEGWNAYEYFVIIDTFMPQVFLSSSDGKFYYDHLGSDGNRSAVSSLGAIIDSDYVFNTVHPEGEMVLGEDGIYLAYRAAGWSIVGDAEEQIYAYGWIHFYLKDDGALYATSAFDLDGGAMYVGGGAVPEPASGALTIAGCLLLMLRRRRIPKSDARSFGTPFSHSAEKS